MVVGGCVIDGCGIATRSVYDLGADGSVREGPELTVARVGHTATRTADDDVVVVGGYEGEGLSPLDQVEVRRAGATEWTATGRMSFGRGGHDAALLGDGRVLVVGGLLGRGQYTASSEIVDPTDGTVVNGPDLPVAAAGLTAVTLGDGSVLLAGGEVARGVATATAAIISADGERIDGVGPLLQARFKHAMVALPNGGALVIGGTIDDERLLASTEVYDPRTSSFRPGPDLRYPRYKLSTSAALLPDGRVVVAGGGRGAEVVDLDAGTSTPVPDVTPAVASFSTVTVWRDDLLVLGGYDERIRLTRLHQVLPLGTLPTSA